MPVRNFRDLNVWQKAMEFVVDCYRVTKEFPSDELYGLTSQLRRAAVSVPANIAEGHSRPHRLDYLRHLGYARGSLSEAQTHLEIARRLGYVSKTSSEKLEEQANEIAKMLHGLMDSLRQLPPRGIP